MVEVRTEHDDKRGVIYGLRGKCDPWDSHNTLQEPRPGKNGSRSQLDGRSRKIDIVGKANNLMRFE